MKKISVKVLALASLMLSLQFCNTSSNESKKDKQTDEKSVNLDSKKGFGNLEIKPDVYSFEAEKGKVIETETGTKITFSADNFVDADGKIVKGKVDISFREFHTIADIMASGITMAYDSAGQTYNFESAGMFEMSGKQNGKEIFIAKEKDVKVDLASYKDGAFNQYELNKKNNLQTYFQGKKSLDYGSFIIPQLNAQTKPEDPSIKKTNGKWFITKTSQLPSINVEKLKKMAELKSEAPTKPIMPEPFNDKEPIMDFDINTKQFPELETFKNIIWQYAGNNQGDSPSKNQWIFETKWSNIKLESANLENIIRYKLILSNNAKTFVTYIKPCLRGQQLESAKTIFAQKNMEYEKEMKNDRRSNIDKEMKKIKIKGDFIRAFAIQNFGTYNCDIISSMRNPMRVVANFGDLTLSSLCLISGDRSFREYRNQKDVILFDQGAVNQIVANIIDSNGKAKTYHFSKDEFAQLDFKKIKETGKIDINLREVNMDNLLDFRKMIN